MQRKIAVLSSFKPEVKDCIYLSMLRYIKDKNFGTAKDFKREFRSYVDRGQPDDVSAAAEYCRLLIFNKQNSYTISLSHNREFFYDSSSDNRNHDRQFAGWRRYRSDRI